MNVGDQVILIDDKFDNETAVECDNLPIKRLVYTIETKLGDMITLKGVTNPVHCRFHIKRFELYVKKIRTSPVRRESFIQGDLW